MFRDTLNTKFIIYELYRGSDAQTRQGAASAPGMLPSGRFSSWFPSLFFEPLDPFFKFADAFEQLGQLPHGGLHTQEAMIVGGWDTPDDLAIREVVHDGCLIRYLHAAADLRVIGDAGLAGHEHVVEGIEFRSLTVTAHKLGPDGQISRSAKGAQGAQGSKSTKSCC